jgi:hypothetical protein
MRLREAVATGLVLLCVAPAACATAATPEVDGGVGDDDGGVGDDALGFGDVAVDGGCGGCSADLHDVVDCQGHVLQTCPPDQGCASGKCIGACAAASANKDSIGCDFFTADPEIMSIAGRCFAAFVANTWASDVTLTVDRAGQSLPVASFARLSSGNGQSISYAPLPNGKLPAGEVAILFLVASPGTSYSCPGGVTPAWTTIDGMNGTAFHIQTDRPVVAYDIWPYGGGNSAVTDATLLLPTSAWDTNYLGVDGYGGGASWISIIASEDHTDVTLSPTADMVSAGNVITPKGTPASFSMNRGEVFRFRSGPGELVGTPIQATKPVGLFGGADCLYVPASWGACDSLHEQLPPVRSLGHEYVYARYRDRVTSNVESPPVRIVGAVDGTILTYDPATPNGAPSSIDSGRMAEFSPSAPFVVRSQDDQHPFLVVAYMTGGGPFQGRGDPEIVNVVPPQQYRSDYVFFTDPTYPETELVVVRAKSANGFAHVTLDCAGTLGGWRPIDASDHYEYTRVDLVTGNFQSVGGCDNGRHEMSSTAPFGLTVWGWGSDATGLGTNGSFYSMFVSYAYPAGQSVQPINTVVVPPLPR